MKHVLLITILAAGLGCSSDTKSSGGGSGATTAGETTGDTGDTAGVTGGDTAGSTDGCTPSCGTSVCGDDGCGGSCGSCSNSDVCEAGACVESTCTPDCADKVCGSDGCGATCGDCQPGESCDVGQCVPPAVGDCGVCAPGAECGAGAPDLNETWCVGSVCGDLTFEGECLNDGATVTFCDNDLLISIDCGFLSDGANGCVFNEGEGYFDCAPIANCDGKVCGDDGAGGSCGECGVDQACSEDGQCEECIWQCDGKSCGDNGCGGTCGTCGAGEVCDSIGACLDSATIPGNTCATAFNVAEVPFESTGNTQVASPEFGTEEGQCDGVGGVGAGSNDHVYSFTPQTAGVYTIQVEGFDSALYVATDCADVGGTCVSGTDSAGDSETLVVTLASGTTYFVVVDGWSPNDNVQGEYAFSISAPCVPSCDSKDCGSDGCGGSCGDCGDGELCDLDNTCVEASVAGGNLCGNPFVVPGLPYAGMGDTSNATNAYSVGPDTCMVQSGGASPEQIFSFTSVDAGIVAIDVTADFYFSVYLTTVCPELPEGVASLPLQCLAGADSETLFATVEAGATYHLFVDGEGGAYALDIDTCTPDCTDKVCGDDGCGGDCGECSGDTPECNLEGQCVACVPLCDGASCGADGCGGVCGECPVDQGCVAGQCAAGASCDGACNDQAAGGCWCDDQCVDFGDCCEDRCDFCAAELPPEQCTAE